MPKSLLVGSTSNVLGCVETLHVCLAFRAPLAEYLCDSG